MLESLLWFTAALGLVFLINLAPAFMPSSWMILAFFYIKFDLPLVPLALAGAIVSGFGRILLAKGSHFVTATFFKGKAKDLEVLGRYLRERQNLLPVVVFLYALTPLPTNNLFVAAGMVRANLWRVIIGFWAARMPADLLWIWLSNKTFHSIGDVFQRQASFLPIILQVGALTSIVAMYALPWGKWLTSYLGRNSTAKVPAKA